MMDRNPACQEGAAAVMLATVRPGLVMHLWQDGHEVAAVHLAPSAALILAADLLRTVSISLGEQQGPTTSEDGA